MIENITRVKKRIDIIKQDIRNIHEVKNKSFKKEMEKTKKIDFTRETEKVDIETKLKELVDDKVTDNMLNPSLKSYKKGEMLNKNKLDFYKMLSEKLF